MNIKNKVGNVAKFIQHLPILSSVGYDLTILL